MRNSGPTRRCSRWDRNFIEMDGYPQARVHPVNLPKAIEVELEARLALIYVGLSHSSSHIHEMVVRELQDSGPSSAKLECLRGTAAKSRDATSAGDFVALGQAMIENTEAQRNLHPELVGTGHQQIIDIAKEHGALGWKVNGAGGRGIRYAVEWTGSRCPTIDVANN